MDWDTLRLELLQLLGASDSIIDEKVLNLYGITELADRQRILGSAPKTDDEAEATDISEKDSEPEEE